MRKGFVATECLSAPSQEPQVPRALPDPPLPAGSSCCPQARLVQAELALGHRARHSGHVLLARPGVGTHPSGSRDAVAGNRPTIRRPVAPPITPSISRLSPPASPSRHSAPPSMAETAPCPLITLPPSN